MCWHGYRKYRTLRDLIYYLTYMEVIFDISKSSCLQFLISLEYTEIVSSVLFYKTGQESRSAKSLPFVMWCHFLQKKNINLAIVWKYCFVLPFIILLLINILPDQPPRFCNNLSLFCWTPLPLCNANSSKHHFLGNPRSLRRMTLFLQSPSECNIVYRWDHSWRHILYHSQIKSLISVASANVCFIQKNVFQYLGVNMVILIYIFGDICVFI